jgi:hypothetical protein
LNERILTVINKSENEKVLELTLPPVYNLKTALNLLDESESAVTDSKLTVRISPIGYKIYKLN